MLQSVILVDITVAFLECGKQSLVEVKACSEQVFAN